MFAAVDLGSNSFRLHIGRHEEGEFRIVKTAREPIRLGAGLDRNGNLTDAAMQSALDCLMRFAAVLSAYPLTAVRVVATNTLRIANNAAQFLPLAEKAIRYPIEIISGEEEGRLIYLGVASVLANPDERRLVIDIGGGSTELILGQGHEIERVESFGIGTVKQSLTFFPDGRIDAPAYEAAILSARSVFEDAAPPYHPQFWQVAYGSSGTIRVIAEVIARNALGDGLLSVSGLEALKQRFIAAGQVNRIDLTGMKPERAAVMVGGLAILIGVMQELGVDALTPIEAGLRMGVLWDLQLRATKRDRREQSVRGFLQRFRADQGRANQVAESAGALYLQLKPAAEGHTRLLYWSALLHEVGMAVSHSGYHKHAAYMIENADLPGFTTREQRIMSTLILAQKGNLRKLNDALVDPDFAKAVLALRLAVMLMHGRIGVDQSQLRLRMKTKARIDIELRRDLITQHPTLAYWLEKEREWWDAIGTELVIRQTG
ncbi:exopolyphosphatase/guanosine-5'-triphosphate,3'-diphosphate pyrophosphatase [Actimicrobium sp. GrIS 1.19]|uniref:Ppx/GppA phosphatase family protein n=1 Tax=Actimicrobium sp. GrIS 1.19 TaxID=3071708 RepID=UPI002DF77769|nr:exopolyphosphatase/guanosine-5'-triphosphate,3'-diphosphate pyrophosphatase [Actimicrobium sp. GrIS 1.19]